MRALQKFAGWMRRSYSDQIRRYVRLLDGCDSCFRWKLQKKAYLTAQTLVSCPQSKRFIRRGVLTALAGPPQRPRSKIFRRIHNHRKMTTVLAAQDSAAILTADKETPATMNDVVDEAAGEPAAVPPPLPHAQPPQPPASRSRLVSATFCPFFSHSQRKTLARVAAALTLKERGQNQDEEVALEHVLAAAFTTDLATRREVEAAVEEKVVVWMARFLSLPDLKHVHYHGSVDFSAGRLSPAEIQVFRVATFVAMGPAPDRIPSSAIPVYYFPSTMSSSYYAALATHWSLVGQVARAPTLPKVRKISTNGDQFTEAMDPSVLLAYMSEDVAVGRRPVLVVARACTSSTTSGEWDDLQAVREICIKYGCWMHVECDNMSLLEVEFASHDASTMRKLASLRSADSISFNAPVAFKLTRPEDLSAVTLFNTVDPRLMDPLHVDVHEHFGDKSSLQQQLLLSRRRSGVFGSAGGAGMTRDRLSVDLTGSLGLESLSRSDSVSSAATSSTGGVQTLGAGLSSSKLLKRMSSSALFQSACFSIAGAGVHVKPTSIEFTLPWLVWSAGPLPETLREIHEVGKELTAKLSDALSSAPELDVLQPPSTSNYLNTLFRFNPTVSASQTLLSHPTPPTHVSHVPQNPAKPVMPNSTPWESGFGTVESLLEMEKGRREAWGNRKNADIGTRFLYQNLSKEVRNGLQLELVNFAGGLYIRCSPLSHTASEESDNFTLLQHLALESVQLAKSINATLKHQATLQSIVADLAIANPADPIELCYIPPSSVSVWPSAAGSVQEDEAWVGLGGLHFTPTYLNLFAEHVDAVVVKDVDALNICLAEALADEQADGIYSKGVVKKEWMEEKVDIGAFALVKTCVRVGNYVSGYNLDKLRGIVESVLKKGRELERGDQFLATISEVVKRGIQTAEQDLKKSSLNEEVSLFRSLPVIGTVLGLMGVGSESQTTLNSQESTASLPATLKETAVNRGLHLLKKPFARTFTLSSGFNTVPIATVKDDLTRASSVGDRSVVGLVDELEESLEEDEEPCVHDSENLDADESVNHTGLTTDLGADAGVEKGLDYADQSM